MTQKSGRRRRRRSPAGGLLAAIAVLALALYLAGGVRETRPSRAAQPEIARNVAALTALAQQPPADLDAEVRANRKAMLDARGGILVDDLAAEQEKILSMAPADKAQLQTWFRDAAIVGDSIARDIVSYGWLDMPPVIAKIGVRALPESDLLDATESVRPSVIFLTFGLNDIENYEERVEVFTRRYRAVIERLQASLPDAVIYVHAVFPPAERVLPKKPFYQYLELYNAELEALCGEAGAYFIDGSFILKADESMYNNDGVHMVRGFYPLWLTYLADIAGLSNDA